MTTEAPVNAGHRFANIAEDYEENEDWLKAADSHSKAAEQFEIAMNDTDDAEAIKTLRLLSLNHSRKAKELQRKANRIQQNTIIKAQNNHRDKGLLNILHKNKKSSGLMVSRLAGIYEEPSNSSKLPEISESYALLSTDDQEDDPFNKFLEAVEGLVQQFFNPTVAFTSVPLNENDKPIPHTNKMLDSYYVVPTNTRDVDDEQYQLENEQLKLQLAQLKKRLKTLEISDKENTLLKSSVLQFRNDVHKQAKRIMQSHHESTLKSSFQQPRNRPDLLTRLKELEEENKQLRLHNEKQKLLMNKYKERWEMLKENAKKRRASTTATA